MDSRYTTCSEFRLLGSYTWRVGCSLSGILVQRQILTPRLLIFMFKMTTVIFTFFILCSIGVLKLLQLTLSHTYHSGLIQRCLYNGIAFCCVILNDVCIIALLFKESNSTVFIYRETYVGPIYGNHVALWKLNYKYLILQTYSFERRDTCESKNRYITPSKNRNVSNGSVAARKWQSVVRFCRKSREVDWTTGSFSNEWGS